MKNIKKLNTKGFAHWIIPALVVLVVGSIGSYVYLRSSHADVCDNVCLAQACKARDGVWLPLRSQGIDHDSCWSNSGAYLVELSTHKVDHVPRTGLNPQTGTRSSVRMNNPDYVIIAGTESQWKLCGTAPSGSRLCTSTLNNFTHSHSAAYRNSSGGESQLHGGGYSLSKYAYFWGSHTYTKFSTTPAVSLERLSPQ